jgi:hypothetical protein
MAERGETDEMGDMDDMDMGMMPDTAPMCGAAGCDASKQQECQWRQDWDELRSCEELSNSYGEGECDFLQGAQQLECMGGCILYDPPPGDDRPCPAWIWQKPANGRGRATCLPSGTCQCAKSFRMRAGECVPEQINAIEAKCAADADYAKPEAATGAPQRAARPARRARRRLSHPPLQARPRCACSRSTPRPTSCRRTAGTTSSASSCPTRATKATTTAARASSCAAPPPSASSATRSARAASRSRPPPRRRPAPPPPAVRKARRPAPRQLVPAFAQQACRSCCRSRAERAAGAQDGLPAALVGFFEECAATLKCQVQPPVAVDSGTGASRLAKFRTRHAQPVGL